MKKYNVDEEKLKTFKESEGFIAALDNSGGSTPGMLERFGIPKDSYKNEDEMFDLAHKVRTRIIKADAFNSESIRGAILFEGTVDRKVDGLKTADYLWEVERIVPFLKIDKGLDTEKDGVRLMKDIPNLDKTLDNARNNNIFGVKQRSVILDANEEGIKKIVDQQFELASKVCEYGLVPIIEPEVDIKSPNKEECELLLFKYLDRKLKTWPKDNLIILKLTLPNIPNLYDLLNEYPCVLKQAALSGGYDLNTSCFMLSQNEKMIASFSRALFEGLNIKQNDNEFNAKIKDNIDVIKYASCKESKEVSRKLKYQKY